jgi:hypothetical protein
VTSELDDYGRTLSEQRVNWVCNRLLCRHRPMTHAQLMDEAVSRAGDGWHYDGTWQSCLSPAQVYSGLTKALANARIEGRIVAVDKKGERRRYALPFMVKEKSA